MNLGDHGIDMVFLSLTLFPVMQTDSEVSCRRALSEHLSVTCGSCVCLDLRDGIYPSVNFSHDFFCLCDIRSRRSTYVHVDRTHILFRNETCLCRGHHIVQTAAGSKQENDCQPFALEHEQHDMLVFVDQLSESCVKSLVEAA